MIKTYIVLVFFTLNACQAQIQEVSQEINSFRIETMDFRPLSGTLKVIGTDSPIGNTVNLNINFVYNSNILDSLSFKPFGKYVIEYGILNRNLLKIVTRNWSGCESNETIYLLGVQNKKINIVASYNNSYNNSCSEDSVNYSSEKAIIDYLGLSPGIVEYHSKGCLSGGSIDCLNKSVELWQNKIDLFYDKNNMIFYNGEYVLDGSYIIDLSANKRLSFQSQKVPAIILMRRVYIFYDKVWFDLDKDYHIMQRLYR